MLVCHESREFAQLRRSSDCRSSGRSRRSGVDAQEPQPVVGINLYGTVGLIDTEVELARLEHAFLSGLTGADVDVNPSLVFAGESTFQPTDAWYGAVTFTSTYYDITEYRNYLTPEGPTLPGWGPGDDVHTGVVTLFCGSGPQP